MADGVPVPDPGRQTLVGSPVSDGPLLRLSGITKTYGPTRAIVVLSFTVAAGDIVGLIGSN